MKKSKLIFAVLFTLLVTACGGGGKDPTPTPGEEVAVEKVVIKSSTELTVGDTETLSAVITPADATNKTLTWQSSNVESCTVSATGELTAVHEGSAIVTAKAHNGITAACKVTVKSGQGEIIHVESIFLDQETMTIGKGATITLTSTILPINADNFNVVFDTTDPEILEVTPISESTLDNTSRCTVKALAKGEADVIVAAVDNGKTDICHFIVKEGDAEKAVIKTPTEIVVNATFNDTYGTLIQNAIAELSIEEPNLTVTYKKISGAYDDLATTILNGFSTNDYPDVAVQYPDAVANFISANRALNVDKYMNNADYGWTEEEKEDVYASYLAEGQSYTIDGTYSLPAAKSTEAMYYDGDKLLGINLSDIDPTINDGRPISDTYLDNLSWEELFDHLCPALVEYNDGLREDEKIIKTQGYESQWAVLGYDADDNLFITLAEQYGYGYTSIDEYGQGLIEFNNQGMKDLMRVFNDAYNNHYFTSKGLLGGSTYVNSLSNADAVLFSIGSTGGVSYQFSSTNPKDVRVAHIPHAEGKDRKTISQGPSFAFLKHFSDAGQTVVDENRAIGSWLFYKKFASTKFATPWSMTTGYSPIRKSVAQSDDWIDYCDIDNTSPKTIGRLLARNAVYSGSCGDELFISPVFKGSSEARAQVGGLLTTLCGKSPEELTDDLINQTFQAAYDATIQKM